MSKHERTFSVEMTVVVSLTLAVKGRAATARRVAHERAVQALERDGAKHVKTTFGPVLAVEDAHPECKLCGYAIWPEAPLTAVQGRKRIKVCQECWDQLVQEE